MRTVCLALTLLALTGSGASALCRCACVDGKARSSCSSALDPPAICRLVCPLSVRAPGAPPPPPAEAPVDAAGLPGGGGDPSGGITR